MKRIRWYLGLPLAGLQLFVAYTAGWTLGLVIKILQRISHGAYHHIAWPLLIAKRWVRGEPTWKYEDLAVGRLQPLTKHQRELAEADERIQRVECVCGKRTCAARHGLYRPALPLGFHFPSKEEVAKFMREQELEHAIDVTQARVNEIAREFIASNPEMKARAEAEVRRLSADLVAKGFTADEILPAFKARGYDIPRSE